MLERYRPAKKPENNGEAIFRESGSEKGGKERTEVAGWGKEEKEQKKRDGKSMTPAQSLHCKVGNLHGKGVLETRDNY